MASFVLTTCQIGAEKVLKEEVARLRPEWRFAYSRPGFVTFKCELPPTPEVENTKKPPRTKTTPAPEFQLDSVFARSHSPSLGKAAGKTAAERAAAVLAEAKTQNAAGIMVFGRDGIDATHARERIHPVQSAAPGSLLLDVIVVEEDEWWMGLHTHDESHRFFPSVVPGGIFDIPLPDAAPSRAYLKLEEGLAWSRLPLQKDEHSLELGSSPGGASYALLEHGLHVTGVDPADMDPRVLANPSFRHVRLQASQLDTKHEINEINWIFSDMNIDPKDALKAVRHAMTITESTSSLRGGLVTLKLNDWNLAGKIPSYLETVRSWGFPNTRCAQLFHNRQEVALAFWR